MPSSEIVIRSGSSARGKYLALTAFLVCLFLAGFLVGEDSMGGGIRIDLYQFHGPTIIALREKPWAGVLADYTSATTPLFHILESFNPLFGHDTAFRAFNVALALLTTICFIIALLRRFPMERSLRWPATLIGASMLLSPYYRAEAYWVTTDILPIFFLVLAAILFIPTQDLLEAGETQNPGVMVGLAVLTWSTFYCRQTYLFAPVYVCVLLVSRYRRQRWLTLATFAVLALPAVYLVRLWKGLNPPRFQHHEKISQNGIVAPFSMIFIYATPFLVEAAIANRHEVSHFVRGLKRYWPWLVTTWLLFLGIFRKYRFDQFNRGGGIASRILSRFGTPGALLFITFGYLGFLVVVWLFRGSTWRGRLLIVLFLLPAMAMSLFFQRYYDPLLIVLFFLTVERALMRPFLRPRMAFLLMGFNSLLLAGALIYNGHDKPVFLPLNSSVHPWDGTALDGKVH